MNGVLSCCKVSKVSHAFTFICIFEYDFSFMIEINMFVWLSSSWSIDAIKFLLGSFYTYVAALDMICMIITCQGLRYAMIDV